MVQIDVVYEGRLRCRATHGSSGSSILTDAPEDNHGQGLEFSPTDLVAASLGTCMMTLMGIVAERENIDILGSTVRVIKEMTPSPPRRIAKLSVLITVAGNLSEEQEKKLRNAALTCPVHRSLHPDIEIPVQFQFG